MIVTRIQGGLGNQLFQYAIGRRLAHEHNVPLKLDISALKYDKLRTYRLGYFNIVEDFASDTDVWRLGNALFSSRIQRAIEKRVFRNRVSLHRQKVVKELINNQDVVKEGNNIYLDGYWQNENYFKSIEALIRTEFTVKTTASDRNKQIIEVINDVQSISLHIRRGDYASDPTTRAIHGLLPLEYYHKAVGQISKSVSNPHFFIFSDDPQWAKDNLRLTFPTYLIDFNGVDRDYEDIRLMSLCKHHIVANSSFSWWGAWLSTHKTKQIFTPDPWFAHLEPWNMGIVPKDWRRITL